MTHSFYRSYGFLAAMLACIVLGCAVGAAWPRAVCLEPLGTVFINMMFCLVVPRLQLLARGVLLCSLDALLEGVPFLDALLADVDRYKGV